VGACGFVAVCLTSLLVGGAAVFFSSEGGAMGVGGGGRSVVRRSAWELGEFPEPY
jgi:hypothetical protein